MAGVSTWSVAEDDSTIFLKVRMGYHAERGNQESNNLIVSLPRN